MWLRNRRCSLRTTRSAYIINKCNKIKLVCDVPAIITAAVHKNACKNRLKSLAG